MRAEDIIELIYADKQLAAIRARIEAGKGTFNDTAAYCNRSAELLGRYFSESVLSMDDVERIAANDTLLRDRYTDINALLETVQITADKAAGINLKPRHAPYNKERAEQIGQALTDKTAPDEVIQRRADSAPANFTRSTQDDYIKENTRFRSGAGLKCYIVRISDGEPCTWCNKLAGRYEYGSEPDDVYRRHDNCGCTVTYECGRQRQNVWTKRTWEEPAENAGAPEPERFTQDQAAVAGAEPPKVFSKEEAAELEDSKLTDEATELGRVVNYFTGNNYKNTITDFEQKLPKLKNKKVSALLNRAHDDVVYAKSDNNRSKFRKHENKILLSNGSEPSTVAHELFHKIDFDNKVSISGAFDDELSADYENLLNLSQKSGQKIEDVLYYKYPRAFKKKGVLNNEYRGISDILEGVTNGSARLGYGHIQADPEYWNKPFKIQKEVFAQYGRICFDENEDVQRMLNELFPMTMTKIDSILDDLLR